MKKRIRFLEADTLPILNMHAIRAQGRFLRPEEIAKAVPGTALPISFEMLHNDVALRCVVVLNAEGARGTIDVPLNHVGMIGAVEIDVPEETPTAPEAEKATK